MFCYFLLFFVILEIGESMKVGEMFRESYHWPWNDEHSFLAIHTEIGRGLNGLSQRNSLDDCLIKLIDEELFDSGVLRL